MMLRSIIRMNQISIIAIRLFFVNNYYTTTHSSRTVAAFLTTITNTVPKVLPSLQMKERQEENDPLTERGLPTPLILGSGSFTRKLILGEMNIPFLVKVKSINEKAIGNRQDGSYEGAKTLTLSLARAKATALIESLLQANPELLKQKQQQQLETKSNDDDISNKHCMVLPPPLTTTNDRIGGYVILTSDQVVTHDNTILEKPATVEQAIEYVQSYVTKPPCRTVGAIVLTHVPSMISVENVDTASIYFSNSMNGPNVVNELLSQNQPILQCAGGLMIEHELVQQHLEKIEGTTDSVMGLSKELVLQLLTELKQQLVQHNNNNT